MEADVAGRAATGAVDLTPGPSPASLERGDAL